VDLDWIVEPFRYGALWRGLVAALVFGLLCAPLGIFVVYRRLAFVGDAMSHCTLPGLVIAQAQGWNLFLGALVADVCAALGITWLSRRPEIREDTAIGICYTAIFGLGLVIAAKQRSFQDLVHLLAGDILAIAPLDLALIGGVAAVVIAGLALFAKELVLASYDPEYAAVIGIRPRRLRLVLFVLLALTVVSGVQVVGVILTASLLVIPAATAALCTRRLTKMVAVAAGVVTVSTIVGFYASFLLDIASGATVVLASALCFVLAYLWRSIKEDYGE